MSIATRLILLSFLLSFILSVTGWFEQFSSATLFGMGAVISAGGFAILHWVSTSFREYTRARELKRLTRMQVLRLFGILALVKSSQGVLPTLFAVPTGLMDIAFAITSFWVASRLVSSKGRPSPGFFVWHAFGLVALAISALLALLTSSTRFCVVNDGITSQPMTWFPMSMVPTFIGPLMVICHLLAIVAGSHQAGQPRNLK